MTMANLLRIGELAQCADCLVETIRYYERENLLAAPARSQANYRLYGPEHVKRLQFIRHCRSLDMTLDEIRALLQFKDAPEANCTGVNTLLDKHIEHVAHRIAELKALQRQLGDLRALCRHAQAVKDCGILQELSSADNGAPAKLGSHGKGCH